MEKERKKLIKIEGFEPITVAELHFYRMASVLLFPFYALAYGISKLFNICGNEDMETFREWFILFDKNAVR